LPIEGASRCPIGYVAISIAAVRGSNEDVAIMMQWFGSPSHSGARSSLGHPAAHAARMS